MDDENRREFKNLKEEEYVFEADDQSRGDWGATQLKRVSTVLSFLFKTAADLKIVIHSSIRLQLLKP